MGSHRACGRAVSSRIPSGPPADSSENVFQRNADGPPIEVISDRDGRQFHAGAPERELEIEYPVVVDKVIRAAAEFPGEGGVVDVVVVVALDIDAGAAETEDSVGHQ